MNKSTMILAALVTVLYLTPRAQAALVTAGELIVDVRNQDLSAGTNVWVNHASGTNSVGDFMQLDSGVLNMVPALGDGTNYANALLLDGIAANAVTSATNTPSSVESNEACSVEAWVYAKSINTAQTVVSWGDTTAHGALRQFRYGRLFGAWYIDATDWGTTLPVGQWTHVAWVYDPPIVYGYINGVNTITADLSTDSDYPLITKHTHLSLGAARPGGTADAFDGYIADIRVHTGVLSASEVLNNFNEGMVAPDLSPSVTGLEDASLFVGQGLTLEPIITGGLPLTYQWSSNSVAIVGATNSTLTLTNVQLAANGTEYAIAVSNAWGSTANSMTLTVETVPDTGPRTININVGRSSGDVYSGKAIAPGAGTVWNLFNTTGTTSPHTINGIVDSHGNALDPVAITISSAQNLMSTYTDTSAGSPNPLTLMKDYMYKGLLTVTVTGLPDGEYDLYVYAHGNNAGQTSMITVASTNGGAFASTTDLGDYRDIYQTNYPALNNSYVAVTGTVSGVPVFTFTTDYLNGFQIQNALPVIEAMTDLTVAAGTNLVIDPGVAGRSPSCQWSYNSVEIPGETNATLRLDKVQPAQSGEYSLAINNSLGSDTASMILTVSSGMPITIDSIAVAGGTASISWTSDAGTGYNIESASNLVTPSWVAVATNVTSSGSQTTDVPLGGTDQEFYRIKK